MFIYSMVNNTFQVVLVTNSADGNSLQAWEKHKPRQSSFQTLFSSLSCLFFEDSLGTILWWCYQSPRVGAPESLSAGQCRAHTPSRLLYRSTDFKRDFWIRHTRRQAAHTKPLANHSQGVAALFMAQDLHHCHVGSDSRQPKPLEVWRDMFRALTILTTTGRTREESFKITCWPFPLPLPSFMLYCEVRQHCIIPHPDIQWHCICTIDCYFMFYSIRCFCPSHQQRAIILFSYSFS